MLRPVRSYILAIFWYFLGPNLDCVEFYRSHVLAKFLIVGPALCTKNQSHEYYLDCVKSISEPWAKFGLCWNHNSEPWLLFGVCLFHKPEPCVLFGPLVLFSTEEYSNKKVIQLFNQLWRQSLSQCLPTQVWQVRSLTSLGQTQVQREQKLTHSEYLCS